MVWNTMILSQYVIVCRLVGHHLPEPARTAMTRHYRVTVTPEGGWGLHQESGPSPYCTALAHIALRLLGNRRDDPLGARSAAWLRSRPGGARAVPTWGKLWLAFAGLHDYRAVNPLPPELFLLPPRLPFHPDRLYCHTRTIYQAMAYLYGIRFSGDLGRSLTGELRDDLFGGEHQPPFRAQRRLLGTDAAAPPRRVLRAAFDALALYEHRPPCRTRERALARCLDRVTHEQEATRDLGLSPVSSLLNVLVLYASGAGPAAVDRALKALDHWRWADPERGIRYAGARTQTWDTAFAVEALLAHRPDGHTDAALRRACAYLRHAQVTEDVPRPEVTARAPAAGGWCVSDPGHRWPVSDCTAEAVTALLHTGSLLPGAPLPDGQRLRRATAFLLHRQNRDGGFGSYEPRRGSRLLEAANPAEMFSHCMVEDSYTECTGSALVALAELGRLEGRAHREAVTAAVRSGARFLLRTQRRDGSWRAAWGVNRIYGTLFAVRGLRAAGAPPGHPRLARAAHWLESVQRADGGWGEHHRGCTEDRYVEHPESQPVTTAWALLALLQITGPGTACVRQGVQWLCDRQTTDGSWRQEAVTGVFFGTAMLDYRRYADYFPLWALGAHLAALGRTG
ncbi:prenyltransferase/squalene oxidase repeat-containing protein [Streptomyces sp. UNOC14_S4]|uniref:prenyltransferase/squalene oxidase repeat-containing protein n=1 Tax=Streptomyces sp. UNOC14_S4 TaxID=2872340 RepID=UPI001E51154A|nr:prenyltransferase/squalene oxidase repeat-containing protein [Streptomyces sp. UNOC14_S4]